MRTSAVPDQRLVRSWLMRLSLPCYPLLLRAETCSMGLIECHSFTQVALLYPERKPELLWLPSLTTCRITDSSGSKTCKHTPCVSDANTCAQCLAYANATLQLRTG